MSRFGKTYEARKWLMNNPNPGALGFNVLRTTENALRLVNELYEAGAQKVHVANAYEPGPGEPGLVSDTLLVRPPSGNWRHFITVMATLDADEIHLVEVNGLPAFRVWWD
jgi:hypothetical protein